MFDYSLFIFLWEKINVYSDSFQVALKYLKDTKVDISNVLIITGNFNIRDSSWNLNFPYHSNILFEITDSFQSKLSRPTEQVPTRYLDNKQDSNLVIDLMFLRPGFLEHDNHIIYSD